MRAEQHEEEEKKKLNAAVDVLAKEAEITKAKSKATTKAPSELDTKPGWRPTSFRLIGKEKVKNMK